MNTLTFRSTLRGQVGKFFWTAAWSIGFWLLSSYLAARGVAIQAAQAFYDDSAPYSSDAFPWIAGSWVCFAFIALFIFISICTLPFEETTYLSNEGGYWNSLKHRYRTIFGNLSDGTYPFEEITDVSVSQSIFDRMLGTGDLTVIMIKYLGTEIDDFEFIFRSVKNPHAVRESLLAHQPPAEGRSQHLEILRDRQVD